jgi:type IV pilus assembly protein PilN
MARINLLPWRETERKRKQREFAVMTATALVATLIVGVGLHLHVERMIQTQNARNAFLNNEIVKLEAKIQEIQELEKTKASLLSRMDVIQQLQQSRPEIVHLFDELVIAIPEGVFLTAVQQTGRTVILEGRAQSNARVSAFMRSIEASAWIGNPSLLLIEHKDKTGTGLSHFKLQFTQKRPEANGGEAEAA